MTPILTRRAVVHQKNEADLLIPCGSFGELKRHRRMHYKKETSSSMHFPKTLPVSVSTTTNLKEKQIVALCIVLNERAMQR